MRIRFAILCCVGLLISCGPRDRVYNPSKFLVHGELAPPDVSVPAAARNEYDGLYLLPADSLSAQLCCWIAPKATLHIVKTARAKSLLLGTYVPEVPAFRATPQSLTVNIPGRPAFDVRNLKPGFHTSLVPLPKTLRDARGIVRVQLSASVDYVPFPGGSAPHYGLLVLSAYFV